MDSMQQQVERAFELKQVMEQQRAKLKRSKLEMEEHCEFVT